ITGKEEKLNAQPYATLCEHLLLLLADYSALKKNIPTDSRWYPRQHDHADWRAGPGCLNRISASISGASAGVRLPDGAAAGGSRLDPACCRQGSNVGGGNYK